MAKATQTISEIVESHKPKNFKYYFQFHADDALIELEKSGFDMASLDVVYYHNSSKKKYPLEIDNRFSTQWEKLCNTLQEASQLLPK